jgi:NAD(P)H-quinone oxidoreductase subunit 6
MSTEQIIFYLFAVMMLGSALLVVTIKSLVRSIFMFFVVLFTLAGLYIFAMADFIAVAQVIIYVGGVLVLMLFAFLLSNKELLTELEPSPSGKFINLSLLPGILIVAVFFSILISVILNARIENISWLNNSPENHITPSDNTIHSIGINTMTRYLLPFEMISVFLMMALIGAAHIARKEQKK